MTIGECLREARHYRNLSQPQALEKMGKNPQWLARISVHEREKAQPTLPLLETYCNAYNIVVSYREDRGWSWRPA